MEEIKMEFENYLKELIKSYPKATETVLKNPSSLDNVGTKSKDFNFKAQAKIKELALKKPNINLINIQFELSSLIVKYHSELMSGHL